MSEAVVEMARLVRLSASPPIPGEKAAHAIARAARRLGFTRGRTTSFWYGKARKVNPDELERAREEAVRRAKDAELLRAEHQRALTILARLEAGLTAIDPDFYQPEISAARDMVGREAGTGDSE